MTVGYDAGQYCLLLCSRNVYVSEDNNPYWDVVKRYSLLEKLKSYPNYVIQGEVYGPKLLKNKLNVEKYYFVVFNIWNKTKLCRLPFEDLVSTCRAMHIPHIQIIDQGDAFQYTIPELLDIAKGFYDGIKNHREGNFSSN
jgi:ATP-dependent RNA circularization protein (DNA/RNA ligase family)